MLQKCDEKSWAGYEKNIKTNERIKLIIFQVAKNELKVENFSSKEE